MTDAPNDNAGTGPELHFSLNVPPENEIGIIADFANIWRTQSNFVLDFATVTQPVQETTNPDGAPVRVVQARVSRIRIPPEQIFPIIRALQEQGDQWLAENGRETPPESFLSAPEA